MRMRPVRVKSRVAGEDGPDHVGDAAPARERIAEGNDHPQERALQSRRAASAPRNAQDAFVLIRLHRLREIMDRIRNARTVLSLAQEHLQHPQPKAAANERLFDGPLRAQDHRAQLLLDEEVIRPGQLHVFIEIQGFGQWQRRCWLDPLLRISTQQRLNFAALRFQRLAAIFHGAGTGEQNAGLDGIGRFDKKERKLAAGQRLGRKSKMIMDQATPVRS